MSDYRSLATTVHYVLALPHELLTEKERALRKKLLAAEAEERESDEPHLLRRLLPKWLTLNFALEQSPSCSVV